MKTPNEGFMDRVEEKARGGLVSTYRSTIQPGMSLYRFGDSKKPNLFLTGVWWIGFSPFEALRQYAHHAKQKLSAAARQCLAVDFDWSTLDVLHKVILRSPLSAWSGTPRTQMIRPPGASALDRRWKPNRQITQLCIPGLGEPDPSSQRQMIWQTAFGSIMRLDLPKVP
jgi:hypothetical protein